MDTEARRTRRNQVFQELKPTCVKLSQLVLKDDGTKEQLRSIESSTSHLIDVLQRRCLEVDTVFDEKLADYVFFPLSHVLKKCQNSFGYLAELATQCLRLLLEYGWKRGISVDLGYQLLLLLTVYAGGGPSDRAVTEELRTEAYGALAALFRDIQNTPKGSAFLVEDTRIPAIGQCLTTILDGIADGPSMVIQAEAAVALIPLWSCIKDRHVLANFLPGTISALTKCLTPTTKAPRKQKVLVVALNALRGVLTFTLGDVYLRNTIKPSEKTGDGDGMNASWLKATASQIKLALLNVVKLREHQDDEVQSALLSLCLTVLDECHTSLAESTALLVETSMILSKHEIEDRSLMRQISLQDLATIYPRVAELIKVTIYNWSISFPRVMQANDEVSKHIAMQQLSRSYGLLAGLDIDSGILNAAIISSLRDGIVSILELSKPAKILDSTFHNNYNISAILTDEAGTSTLFGPVLMPHESQAQTRNELEILICSLGPKNMQLKLARDILDTIDSASGLDLLSSLWLALQLLRAAHANSEDIDSYLDPILTSSNERELVADGLYSHSLSILSDLEVEGVDWRLQAIGLEIIAFSAQTSGEAFRSNLIDALYPVVESLGSSKVELRSHAIACLNSISKSCGYQDTGNMIVENVDYLVNAISLRLNTLDISPQAPQVLIMMIKLSGPRLLPYLDDVVGSIFAALDNFHGYSRLVETLFSVLGEIVEQGNKADQILPPAVRNRIHHKEATTGPSIGDIRGLLSKAMIRLSRTDGAAHEDFPRRPWKSAQALLDESTLDSHSGRDDGNGELPQDGDIQKPTPTKVYFMVQSIARLGQHYLTSQSPLVRRRLLDLINVACDTLQGDEDEFLPLVNDIWPVLIKRLYDEEPFVVIAAAGTVAGVCRCAGDFVTTRIQVEWDDLMRLFRKARMKVDTENKGRHSRGIFAQSRQVWEALLSLSVVIVECVRIQDDMFDDLLGILGYLLSERKDLHRALSAINADAVWLREHAEGYRLTKELPVLEGYNYLDIG